MTRNETAIEETVSQNELSSLAAAKGHCITATFSIPVPSQIRPRINHAVRELEKRLKVTDLNVRTAQNLLGPVQELATTIEAGGEWGFALALYRSSDTFRCFRIPELAKDVITIEDRFQVRPVLPVVSREQRFYILALSQKKIRLFDCTDYGFHEVDLKGRVPQNLQVFLNAGMPDHVLDNRSSGGPDVGSMKGVTFGTNTDRERHNEYLAHFFQEVDKSLHKILPAGSVPMMLAGVEEELAMYRKLNTYKPFIEQEIHGAHDAVPPSELHQRALEIVKKRVSAPLAKIIREFESHRNANRVSLDFEDILAHAQEGRVSELLVREDADHRGLWDEDSRRIMMDGEGDDLINIAALQTLQHGGQAFALTEAEMPDQAEMAAVLRY